jgi:hypothetical protein
MSPLLHVHAVVIVGAHCSSLPVNKQRFTIAVVADAKTTCQPFECEPSLDKDLRDPRPMLPFVVAERLGDGRSFVRSRLRGSTVVGDGLLEPVARMRSPLPSAIVKGRSLIALKYARTISQSIEEA